MLLTNSSLIKDSVSETQYFVVDEKVREINIPMNCEVNILLTSLPKEELHVNVDKNTNVLISVLAKGNLEGSKLKISVLENSHVEAYLADFTKGKEKFIFSGSLLERNATLNWHLSSLTAESDDKKFDISVDHNVPSTFAKMENYGVCKDNGKLVFSGISSIIKGAKGSKTHQDSKIMVFDEASKGIANPILKIDENDIEASHAAVVGKINDDHLFYLTSRGLTEAQAKELITFGYLKPIIKGFIDENIKEEISLLIEGRM